MTQPAAEADLQAALKTFKSVRTADGQFEVWMLLAELMRRRRATPAAFAAVDEALALAEEVRLQSANPELRSTLLQPLRPAFDLKISLLFDEYPRRAGPGQGTGQHLAVRALETAEQARARAQADFRSLDVSAPGLDPKLLARRQALFRELAAGASAWRPASTAPGAADAPTLRPSARTSASLRQDLDQIDARIGKASQTARSRRGGRGARHHCNSTQFQQGSQSSSIGLG